jgi:hypothetical protein
MWDRVMCYGVVGGVGKYNERVPVVVCMCVYGDGCNVVAGHTPRPCMTGRAGDDERTND